MINTSIQMAALGKCQTTPFGGHGQEIDIPPKIKMHALVHYAQV